MDIPWQAWFQTALIWLLRAGLALVVIYIGSRFVGRSRGWVKRLLANPRIPITVSDSITRIATEFTFIALWVLLISFALVLLGVPVQTVVIAVATLLAIVAFALRESLANFAATVIFILFQPFRRGETIETMGFTGTVYDIEVFSTVLLTADERVITLPNAKIQEEGIINYSRMTTARAVVEFVVAYGENIEQVTQIVQQIIAREPMVLPDPAPSVSVIDLNPSGIRMNAIVTVATADRFPEAAHLRAEIIEALIANDIRFPVPALAPPKP